MPRLADWFIVDVAEEDGTMRRVAVRAALPEKQMLLDELHREYQPVIGSGQPAGQALAGGGTVHFPSFTPESLRATTLDERHFELMTKLDPRSAIAVALVARGRVLGALTFAWSESGHRYTEADVTLAEELGRRAALAIENSRLYSTAEQAQHEFGFLVEASDVLASSLDYDETLSSLARLAVPRLGDWCVIYIVEDDGSIVRRAVEHSGGRQATVRAVLEAHPLQLDADVGVPQVIRTGRSELLADASPLSVAGDAEQPERLASALEEIEVRSTMCVPLIARRRTLGAVLFVAAESGRRFDERDLRLAEELAARAAVAVDNSRLFYEAEHRAEAARALDSIADAVFLVDASGAIRIWNAAAETITGLAADEVRGRPARDVFSGWSEIAAVAGAVPHTRAGHDRRAGAVDLDLGRGVVGGDGVRVPRRHRRPPARPAEVGLRRHRLARAAHAARRRLRRRDDARRTRLRRPRGHPPRARAADRRAGRAAVGDRRRHPPRRPDRVGRPHASSRRASIRSRCSRAAVDAARLRARRGARRSSCGPPDEVPEIETDAGRLRQVLDNLLDNAVKYSPDGGPVELRVVADDRFVRFVVSDEGVGIPSAEMTRIFEKFYRVDPQQTGGVSGTGLGLYVCRELVERMDGRITVQSILGRGSAFTVELPLR